MKKLLLPLLLAAITAGSASAWGFFGHRTITQLAIYELPSPMQAFYYRHMAELVRQSTAPDERRNDDPSEGPKHYIDMDHYSEDDPFGKMPREYDKAVEKYTADTLKKYGTVPWVIMNMKDDLVTAFRDKDTTAIIKYSAELGHYISDSFVPLHTTENYDGQMTDQKGLHSLWESTLPEKYIQDYKLYDPTAPKFLKDPLTAVWTEITKSFGFLGETFDRATKIEKTMKPEVRYTFTHRYGKTQRRYSDAFAAEYEKAVGGMVDFRLKGAPNAVASFWLTAWQEAGKPDLNALMTPPKQGKEEKEKLATELESWKKNTLAQDQLLLAQQKVKKAEGADEIKAAKDMAPAPAAEPAEAAPAPAAAPAPTAEPEPAKVKAKVKEDGKTTKQKDKKKDKPKKEEAPAGW
ncbi:zinc dependent phospholipase C family protein [Hymenobacter sp. ASUV-10]|uniref:Zinc dependent phospholipase C family protein n=1 Tax=Hymenobacter aranciens TaxID=3063996 RepID=A0ABT9BC45_9BACT|nr:zinc dependent phospholipase C family protein [Hymenobacter sp. ASUV-10]MDO7875839.1 zinc dependent phospholipase C family protein [Hymenobacter sp. ASUV-10]